MFNFSFAEIALTIIVALLVLGPKQLPVLANKLGTWVKHWRAFMSKLQADFSDLEQKQKILAENEQRAKAADEKYKQS